MLRGFSCCQLFERKGLWTLQHCLIQFVQDAGKVPGVGGGGVVAGRGGRKGGVCGVGSRGGGGRGLSLPTGGEGRTLDRAASSDSIRPG